MPVSNVLALPRSDPDLERAELDPALPRAMEASPVRVGVIGYGYWGPNLVRNFVEIPGAVVAAVSDKRRERLTQAEARHPSIRTTIDCRDLIRDATIDAVVVATPLSSHYELCAAALQAGKHVLVEKPLAATSEQALRLTQLAAERDLVLMVDHTFVYTGAVRRIKELIDSGHLGRLYYYDSVRVNLGLFQHDISVLWDLAVHDLAIMDYLLGEPPCAVAATGIAHILGQPVNTAYLTCYFNTNLLAHLHVNWLAPVKIRRTLIGGDSRMIVYDDLEPSEKVKVYDRGITLDNGGDELYELLVGYRSGDMWAPRVSLTEALRTETLHFLDCVRGRRQPLTDGVAGLRLVRILEAAGQSLSQRGQPVDLHWDRYP